MSVAPTFLTRGARIALSPWAAARMDPDEYARLEGRAFDLDVNVSTVQRRDRSWMIRVRRGSTVTSLVAKGPIGACIAGALDDFEQLDDEDGRRPDLNFEGDPTRNGAFR